MWMLDLFVYVIQKTEVCRDSSQPIRRQLSEAQNSKHLQGDCWLVAVGFYINLMFLLLCYKRVAPGANSYHSTILDGTFQITYQQINEIWLNMIYSEINTVTVFCAGTGTAAHFVLILEQLKYCTILIELIPMIHILFAQECSFQPLSAHTGI